MLGIIPLTREASLISVKGNFPYDKIANGIEISLGHKGCPGKSLSIKGTFPFIKGIKISCQPKGLIFDILGKVLAKISNFFTV